MQPQPTSEQLERDAYAHAVGLLLSNVPEETAPQQLADSGVEDSLATRVIREVYQLGEEYVRVAEMIDQGSTPIDIRASLNGRGVSEQVVSLMIRNIRAMKKLKTRAEPAAAPTDIPYGVACLLLGLVSAAWAGISQEPVSGLIGLGCLGGGVFFLFRAMSAKPD